MAALSGMPTASQRTKPSCPAYGEAAGEAEAKMARLSYIEGWFNPVRLHSVLGYRALMTYEARMRPAMTET